MTGCEIERYHDICKPAFERIEKKLEKIDNSLNGNGSPGVITRLNVIESAATGGWSLIKPILVAVLTSALIGGGIVATRQNTVSAEQIAEVVRQVVKETSK